MEHLVHFTVITCGCFMPLHQRFGSLTDGVCLLFHICVSTHTLSWCLCVQVC